MAIIQGPLGDFHIPDEERAREHVRALSEGVFVGEYDAPEVTGAVRGWNGYGMAIDIGAGWGAFAAWLRARWRHVIVDCYDPHVEAMAYLQRNVPDVRFTVAAVTVDPAPFFGVSWEWGSGHTKGRTDGVRVPAVHPKYLPRASLLKCDAEGVEAEVLAHYPYLDRLEVLMVEWHSPALKAECHSLVASQTELRLVKDETARDYGVSVWVR